MHERHKLKSAVEQNSKRIFTSGPRGCFLGPSCFSGVMLGRAFVALLLGPSWASRPEPYWGNLRPSWRHIGPVMRLVWPAVAALEGRASGTLNR
eukprot:5779043-Pyramimonas_sp.AAC.1